MILCLCTNIDIPILDNTTSQKHQKEKEKVVLRNLKHGFVKSMDWSHYEPARSTPDKRAGSKGQEDGREDKT